MAITTSSVICKTIYRDASDLLLFGKRKWQGC